MYEKSVKIYCLPYAGGSANSIFAKYKKYTWNNKIEIIPFELAGKGMRFEEKFNTSISDIVKEVSNYIMNDSHDEKYAIWGHSMGGLIVYEVVYYLDKLGYKLPEIMIISGSRPPFIKSPKITTYKMGDEHFIEYLISSNGIEEELGKDELFKEVYLPIIKNDFRLLDLFDYEKKEKINQNTLVMYSDEDNSDNTIFQWKEVVSEVEFKQMPGNHFFINDYYEQVANYINSKLNQMMEKQSA